MNFRSMCVGYLEMSQVARKIITARRKIWPPSVYLLLGTMKEDGSPMAVIRSEGGGMQAPAEWKFGMSLVLNGEEVIHGWCPSIDDVMGQDWELTKEK